MEFLVLECLDGRSNLVASQQHGTYLHTHLAFDLVDAIDLDVVGRNAQLHRRYRRQVCRYTHAACASFRFKRSFILFGSFGRSKRAGPFVSNFLPSIAFARSEESRTKVLHSLIFQSGPLSSSTRSILLHSFSGHRQIAEKRQQDGHRKTILW